MQGRRQRRTDSWWSGMSRMLCSRSARLDRTLPFMWSMHAQYSTSTCAPRPPHWELASRCASLVPALAHFEMLRLRKAAMKR